MNRVQIFKGVEGFRGTPIPKGAIGYVSQNNQLRYWLFSDAEIASELYFYNQTKDDLCFDMIKRENL